MFQKSILVIVGLAAASGCATIQPGMRASTFGNGSVDPDRDKAVVEKAEAMKVAPAEVEIFAGRLPEGLELSEQGSKIAVAPGYESQFQVLGTVESDYAKKMDSAFLKNFFWTWNYDETWRKALCWPQAPLKALSLGLWVMVPTAWPCFAKIPSEEEARQKAHLVQLKKLAAAMGGNLVVLTSSGELAVTTMRGGAVVGHSVTREMSAKGFALRWNKSLPAPASPLASAAAR